MEDPGAGGGQSLSEHTANVASRLFGGAGDLLRPGGVANLISKQRSTETLSPGAPGMLQRDILLPQTEEEERSGRSDKN